MRTHRTMSGSTEIFFGFIESTPLHLALERVTRILSEGNRLINWAYETNKREKCDGSKNVSSIKINKLNQQRTTGKVINNY